MRARRLAITTAALAAIAVAVVASAGGTRFADQPCPEAGPGGIRVCPAATVGHRYAIELAGGGGCGPALPYQYRLLGGGLPPGIALAKDGEVSGTPTTAGEWRFWLELSDQNPPSASWCTPKQSQREFLIRVGAPPGTVGAPYSVALGIGADGPHGWTIVSGNLPAGLALNSTTGVIAGTPERGGSYPLAISVLDSKGASATLECTLTMYPKLSFATTRFAPVRIGRAFRFRVKTTGSVGRAALRVVSGRFPIGVRLDRNAHVLRGRPRTGGAFRFTLQLEDSLGRVVARAFVLMVRPQQ